MSSVKLYSFSCVDVSPFLYFLYSSLVRVYLVLQFSHSTIAPAVKDDIIPSTINTIPIRNASGAHIQPKTGIQSKQPPANNDATPIV